MAYIAPHTHDFVIPTPTPQQAIQGASTSTLSTPADVKLHVDTRFGNVDNTSDAQKAAGGPIGDALALKVTTSTALDAGQPIGDRLAEIQFDDSLLDPNDAVAYTAGIQSRINSLNALGGGRLVITRGVKKLIAPYRGTNGIFPGYIANDENRRSNKAVIIFNARNITIDFLPGAIWDRSGDAIADANYAESSCALYISQSKNIRINNYNGIGIQDDAGLISGIKGNTSGDHIQINNGCDGIYVDGMVAQDGTTHLSVGLSRTSGYASLDPAIPACTNVFINNFDGRNGEHDIILFKAYGVFLSGIKGRVYQRSDGTTGVKQRGIYLHACKQVYASGLDFSGVFKTSLLIANYGVVEDIYINGLTVNGMMTPVNINALGGAFSEKYEGHGISIQSDNCKNINVNNFKLKGLSVGVAIPGFGHKDVTFNNGSIDAVFADIMTFSSFIPTGAGPGSLNNPMVGFTLTNISMSQLEDDANYGSVQPNSGVLIQSLAVDGGAAVIQGTGISLKNVTVMARNRNARVLDCVGVVEGCNFKQSLGYVGLAGNARNFDFNYSGVMRLTSNTYGNNGRPNGNQDAPTAASIRGYAVEEIRLSAVTANTTFTVPAGYKIESVTIANTTANAVTGGIKIGTTSGATDVVAAFPVAASAAIGDIPDAQLSKRGFSLTATQTLYLQAVTAWNSASLLVTICLRKVM